MSPSAEQAYKKQTFAKQSEGIIMEKFECYVEEYRDGSGGLCARLREKSSNKKVSFCGDLYDKLHFLRFLSAARLNINIMPTIFNRYGSDIVAVRGRKMCENSDEIEVLFDEIGAGYLFE